MFGINGGEFFFIAVVALIVLGPERLPALARKAGKWSRELRAIATEFRSGVERELGGDPIQEFKDEVGKPVSEFRSQVAGIRKDISGASDEVKSGLEWKGPVTPGPSPDDAAADLARIEAGEDLLADRPTATSASLDGPASLDDIEIGADLEELDD